MKHKILSALAIHLTVLTLIGCGGNTNLAKPGVAVPSPVAIPTPGLYSIDSTLASPPEQLTGLKGKVIGTASQPLMDAKATLFYVGVNIDSGSAGPYFVVTDAAGAFKFQFPVTSGTSSFRLCIEASGYDNKCQDISIPQGSTFDLSSTPIQMTAKTSVPNPVNALVRFSVIEKVSNINKPVPNVIATMINKDDLVDSALSGPFEVATGDDGQMDLHIAVSGASDSYYVCFSKAGYNNNCSDITVIKNQNPGSYTEIILVKKSVIPSAANTGIHSVVKSGSVLIKGAALSLTPIGVGGEVQTVLTDDDGAFEFKVGITKAQDFKLCVVARGYNNYCPTVSITPGSITQISQLNLVMAAVTLSSPHAGLMAQYKEVAHSTLADLASSTKVIGSGTLPLVAISNVSNSNSIKAPGLPATHEKLWGAKIDGYLKIEQAGTYQFDKNSDADSDVNVVIGGVSTKDLNGGLMDSGKISLNLGVGYYPIHIDYTHGTTASYSLRMYWIVPGTTNTDTIPEGNFFH